MHFHLFEQETIETFKVKTKMGDEKFEETVSINEQKEQVTYHVMAQGDLDEADILIDFKKVRAVLIGTLPLGTVSLLLLLLLLVLKNS